MRWKMIRPSVRIGVAVVLLVAVSAASIGAVAIGPEEEPNSGQGEAQEISLGEEVTGELTSGDVDWFQFTAESGNVITISGSTDDVGNTNFELIDANGNQMASVSGLTGQSAQVGATSTYTGTYYLRVERRFTDRGGEYSFTVETTDTDAFEPNEDRANATELTDEEEVEGELTIGDTDWFNVMVEQGDTINLSAFADTSGVTNFQVYDRNGSLIAGQDGISGRFARVNVTATYAGEYYVRVAPRFSDRYGATYNLTVDLPGDPSSETTGTQQGETQNDDGQEETETDSGLPVIPMVVGAIVLLVVVVVWRSRDEEDEPR